MSGAYWARLKESRFGRTAHVAYQYRRALVISALTSYAATQYILAKRAQARRDHIHPNTYLLWRFSDGSIVEQKSPASNLNLLLSSSSAGDEPPRVLTLFEAIRALKWIEGDDRITGLIADFSSYGQPNIPSYSLGLAQIEEIHDAITNLKRDRKEADIPFRTLAVTDTFSSQADYVLATAFDEIYVQPSGEIPLTGLAATIPFYSRLLSWLGIKIHAEARTKWKSMVAPYTQTELSPDQAENEEQLLNDLNENMLTLVARSRYPTEDRDSSLSKLKSLIKKGPFTAREAKELGLINSLEFKSSILKSITGTNDTIEDGEMTLLEQEDHEKPRLHGFYHYLKTTDRISEKTADIMDVGVVYLLGTISGESTDFGTASVIKGLKEAAKDEDIHTVILRIDSGGGGVVESESIWNAVNELKAKGKIVIASFANAAASGGYLAATHADLILAHPSTITGSIGVASIRPTVTQTFLDRFYLNVQSFFTGSKTRSLLHELQGENLARHRKHIDEAYDMFKEHVCDGRKISSEEIEAFAGGRVYSGLRAMSLVASPEQMRQLSEQQNLLPLRSKQEVPPESVPAEELPLPIAQISEGQETSAFATVEAGGPDLEPQPSLDQEVSFPQLGPKGRGLVDSLAGIFEAASIGAELGIMKALTIAREENPHLTDLELIEEVLPGKTIQQSPDGAVTYAFDIRLKAFPEEKTWWERAVYAARRGDSIDPDLVSIWRAAKAALLASCMRMITTELRQMGLPTATYQDYRRAESKHHIALH